MKVAHCIEESSSECLTIGKDYELVKPFEPPTSGFIRIVDDLGDVALYPKNKFIYAEKLVGKRIAPKIESVELTG